MSNSKLEIVKIDGREWQRAPYDGGGPYNAESTEKGYNLGKIWWVKDRAGNNILVNLTQPGAVWTTEQTAKFLAEIWNSENK